MTQLRSFVGVFNVYLHFIKDFSQMAAPLNRWLRKDVKPTCSDPPNEQLQAFQAPKQDLVEPSVLELTVGNRPFRLYTD